MLNENNQGISLRMVWMHNTSSISIRPANSLRTIYFGDAIFAKNNDNF